MFKLRVVHQQNTKTRKKIDWSIAANGPVKMLRAAQNVMFALRAVANWLLINDTAVVTAAALVILFLTWWLQPLDNGPQLSCQLCHYL
jgi:uncharacterized membrane protein YkvA (DUF1232 family)